MKILSIIGSPRRGETYKAVELARKNIESSCPIEMEYLFLMDYEIKDCMGCHLCIKRGEEFCHQAEKILKIKEKIQKADLVILASPNYNGQVTSLMKKWFDYMTFLWHRPEFFQKPFVLVATGGGIFGEQFKYMEKNVECWGGFVLGKCGVPHFESLTEKYRKKTENSVKKLSEKIVLYGKTKKKMRVPRLKDLVWFNIWKINVQACKEDIPVDYVRWTERNWISMDYYYDVKISFLKRVLAGTLTKISKSFMKKVYKGY
jgi:multimeric flavodoxin WrbA